MIFFCVRRQKRAPLVFVFAFLLAIGFLLLLATPSRQKATSLNSALRPNNTGNTAAISLAARREFIDVSQTREPSTVMILARSLSPQVQSASNVLRSYGLAAHIMLDSPIPTNCTDPFVHYLPDSDVIAANFTYLVYKPVGAWDRALLWCYRSSRSQYFWFIEDDVAWTPSEALPHLIMVVTLLLMPMS